MGPNNSNLYGQVVAIRRWLLVQVWLYSKRHKMCWNVKPSDCRQNLRRSLYKVYFFVGYRFIDIWGQLEHLLFWSKAKIIFWMIQFWNFLSAKMALFCFVWQRPILKLWGKVFTFILTINWFWFNYFWLTKNGNLETEPQLVFLGVHGWGQPRTSNTLGLLQFFTFFTT